MSSEAQDFYAGFVDENGNPATSIKVPRYPMLTADERYWLENREAIIDAINKAGFRLMSNRTGFWLTATPQPHTTKEG